MGLIARRAAATALLVGALAAAGCASTGTGGDARYAREPVADWPSQQVLRSFPDD